MHIHIQQLYIKRFVVVAGSLQPSRRTLEVRRALASKFVKAIRNLYPLGDLSPLTPPPPTDGSADGACTDREDWLNENYVDLCVPSPTCSPARDKGEAGGGRGNVEATHLTPWPAPVALALPPRSPDHSERDRDEGCAGELICHAPVPPDAVASTVQARSDARSLLETVTESVDVAQSVAGHDCTTDGGLGAISALRYLSDTGHAGVAEAQIGRRARVDAEETQDGIDADRQHSIEGQSTQGVEQRGAERDVEEDGRLHKAEATHRSTPLDDQGGHDMHTSTSDAAGPASLSHGVGVDSPANGLGMSPDACEVLATSNTKASAVGKGEGDEVLDEGAESDREAHGAEGGGRRESRDAHAAAHASAPQAKETPADSEVCPVLASPRASDAPQTVYEAAETSMDAQVEARKASVLDSHKVADNAESCVVHGLVARADLDVTSAVQVELGQQDPEKGENRVGGRLLANEAEYLVDKPQIPSGTAALGHEAAILVQREDELIEREAAPERGKGAGMGSTGVGRDAPAGIMSVNGVATGGAAGKGQASSRAGTSRAASRAASKRSGAGGAGGSLVTETSNPFDARNWAAAAGVAGAGARACSGRGERREGRQMLDVAGPDELALGVGPGPEMPAWARATRGQAGGPGAGAGGAEGVGAGQVSAHDTRRSRAQANLADGEEGYISEAQWATEEVFGTDNRRNLSKLDRLLEPSARARILFMLGVFVPVLLIPNIVMYCRSTDSYLRKYARYSLVALVM